MATLRSPLFDAPGDISAMDRERLMASGMGDLRRGWESGRISNEMNPLRVDALNAQIAGDTAREKTLRDQVGALEQRQQMYAPRVGRVEDIHGVGDGLDWAAGQVGQGVASMVDPLAVSGGLGLVGRIASAVPNPVAKAVGAAAQLGSIGVPYLMNQRQLAGEYLGDAGRDKVLMERTSPQALRDSANTYGLGAAALDTVLPAYLGRQLTGAGLRKGISSMSPLAKTGLGMATEGGTETLQSMGSQYAQGLLNPERDTSGDFMENVNSFAGGAVGSGPLTAAGAFADTGYRRVGDTGQRVGEAAQRVVGAAGDTVDLLNNSGPVQQAREAGSKLFGRARGTVTDLMSNEDGEVSSKALLDNLRAATQDAVSKVKTSSEERDILMQKVPEGVTADADIQQWLMSNDAKRADLVAQRLNTMSDDEKAQSILDRLVNGTPDEQQAAVEEGATHLMSQSLVGRATERGEALGRLLTKGGVIAGRGAAGAAKGVLEFGKALMSGVSEGMSKKNAQVASTDETFQDFRDRLYGVQGKQAADQALAQGASYNKAVEFGQRADLAGDYAADMARRSGANRRQAVTQTSLARNLAYTLADMTDQFDTGLAARAPRNDKGLGPKEAKLNRLALDAFSAFRENTPEVIERLGSILGPQSREAVAYLQQETQQLMSPNGAARVAAQRDALGRQAVDLVAPAARSSLMKQGVNLDTADGREQLLKIHEMYADGMTKTPGARKALDQTFGADSVSRILELLNGEPEKTSGLGDVDERTLAGQEQNQEANLDDPDADGTTAFDQRMNEKLVVKGSGPKIYAYGNGAGLRSSDERRDPFAALNTPGADGVVQRPALFDGGQKLSINAFNAFAAAATKGMKPKDRAEWMEDPANRLMTTKKIFDLRARLVADPDYPDHDNYRVESKSAYQVMKDNDMQPGKVLQLYRDYMRMDAADETLSVGQRKYATQQAATAHRMILDAIAKQDADKKLVKFEFADNAERRSELTAAAKEYFEQRQVVTAEQISNRDPEKLGATEVLDLIRDGRSKLDRVRLNNADMLDADKAVATSEANILYFTGKDEKGKTATLPIQAGRLVNLVRKRQGENRQMDVDENGKKFSNKSKDDEYLADVLMGISMLVDSGQVTGMPYMLDRFGKATSFGKAVPDSLMLATQTYGSKKFGDEKRREKQRVKSPEELAPDEEDVARDQDRNADYFAPDDRVERELVESPFAADKRRSGKNDTSTAAEAKDAGGQLVTRGANTKAAQEKIKADFYAQDTEDGPDVNDVDPGERSSRGTSARIRVDVSGQRAVEPKTKDPSLTPLDFSRGQDPSAVDDETTEVLRRTKTSGKSAYTNDIGPEPKGKAVDMAPRRAAEIGAAYMRSEAEGMTMIERRFRMAAAPAYSSDQNAVVGGPHYIAPVAVFVGAKNLAGMDLGPEEAKQMVVLQGRVAQVLQGEGVSKTERVKMARLMSTDPAKVTAMNVDAMLAKVVARAGLTEDAAKTPSAQSAPEVANAGLPKDRQTLSGGSEGRKLNATASNQQDGPSHVSSQAERDEASAYLLKILGPKISVAFKDITGYSGEFIDARNAIEISTMAAAGTMSTAYHEAMHVFFRDFVKGNPKMQAVFESLVNDPRHLAKLEALLTGYPAAQAQLKGNGSGEERLAYTYQFWAAGLLQVDAKAKTWLQKVGKFFRHVLGMARDSEKALELFTAFHEGRMAEPSAAGEVISKALDKGKLTLAARRKFDALIQGVAALTVPSGEILAQSLSPEARKLATKFFTNPGDGEVGGDQEGYMNARRRVATKYSNTFAQIVNDMGDSDQASVQKYLQSRTELADIPLALHRDAVKSVRALLNRFHEHLVEAGLDIGYDADNYYPTMWSMDALLNKKDEFTQMLVSKFSAQMAAIDGKSDEAAERIWLALVNKNGVQEHLPAQREDGVLAPFFASGENRTLSWLKGPDVEPFLQKNLIGTMTGYFHQGARAAEYHRRFGKDGVELEKSLNTINQELTEASKEKMKRGELKDDKARGQWLSRQMRDVSQAVGAMEGTLGKDVSPAMRKFSSWMAVYQNIRLLPMSLFSSFVDPLGLVARGATMPEAYDAFLSGMQKVVQAWGDVFRDMPPERKKSQWESLAEHVGAVDAALFSHHVSDEYASAYMSPGAKKINDKMFIFNGMEAWNRGMRVAATRSAVRFIERHAALPDKNHSKRWLQELGLNPATVPLNSEGNLITSRHELAAAKGIDLAQATREIADVHYAINRWVEGAVLTPNAAQRPAWASDPNYSMFFHLKQFSYSFHQTILKRAVGELKYGNMAPMGAFLWYIPTMIAADVTKGLIQGGGELPAYMKGYDLGDWLMHGYQRAGLSGVGTIGMDAAADVASLGGPAVEQIIDGVRDPIGRTAVNSLPLHALFAQALK